jgi:hypothetical protein
MTIQENNIAVSIFYSQIKWNELINKAIVPFLNTKYISRTLKFYSIYFSKNQGENILIILRFVDDNKKFIDFVTNYFKEYILINPSPNILLEYPLETFFINYPNNSIIINGVKIPHFPFEEAEIGVTSALISLSKTNIGFEEILTLALYLQLGFIKAKYDNYYDAYKGVLEIEKYLEEENLFINENTYLSNDILIYDGFGENAAVIDQIILDVWMSKNGNDEFEWLNKWKIMSQNLLKRNEFPSTFIQINNQIFNHLGINCNWLLSTLLISYKHSFKTAKLY